MPYQHGRSRAWLKVKNPASPAMQRVWEDRTVAGDDYISVRDWRRRPPLRLRVRRIKR